MSSICCFRVLAVDGKFCLLIWVDSYLLNAELLLAELKRYAKIMCLLL